MVEKTDKSVKTHLIQKLNKLYTMQTVTISNRPSLKRFIFPVLVVFCLLLVPLLIWRPASYPSTPILKIEKGGGKNAPHANQKVRDNAADQYRQVKEEFESWDKKPNKTPKDKEFIKKLRRQLERLKKRMDFKGENHSQKHKGN